jgi:hypothetical protein
VPRADAVTVTAGNVSVAGGLAAGGGVAAAGTSAVVGAVVTGVAGTAEGAGATSDSGAGAIRLLASTIVDLTVLTSPIVPVRVVLGEFLIKSVASFGLNGEITESCGWRVGRASWGC